MYVFLIECRASWKNNHRYTGCGKKSNPLGLLAVFSATAENFNAKFYTLIYSSCTFMQVSTAFNCQTLS